MRKFFKPRHEPSQPLTKVTDTEASTEAEEIDVASVLDHDAFFAKYVPDLGQNIKELKVFHWKLTNWKKLEKKLTSSEFDCGGYKWRILLFPFGNSTNNFVSLYLDCIEPKNSGKDWHVCAQLALVISNIHDPTIHTFSHAKHRFHPVDPDWGFTRFIEQHKLFTSQPSQDRPTIEEDSARISVFVRVMEDPMGVLWHDFVDYDSKKHTGYVGLTNQGATGCLNTVLQSLFCINYFRKAVYQVPTEGRRPRESIPLALQRVFYNLQTSNQAVDTTELTKSLGLESSSPHDVLEINKILLYKLQPLMEGTPAEGAIAKLFSGKMKSFIKCVDVDSESSKVEEFNDIELRVKGIRTLYDSFKDYVAVQMLDGEDKYHAGTFGLQKARKGIIFQSFPTVLHLPLRRHAYDKHDTMVKVHDHFEFPFEVDLGEFLDETADKSKPWKYRLHSVLVHSGSLLDGRYYAFVKPDKNTRWLKFHDDRVTPVTDGEVQEESYGGESLDDTERAAGKSTTARMLVYIRETAMDEVLAPLTEEDVPRHLKQGIVEEEDAQLETQMTQIEEQDPLLTIKIVTDETFAQHNNFDLAVFDDGKRPLSNLPIFRVSKLETYSAFKSRVAQHFSWPEKQIRLWVIANRLNETMRPNTYIPQNQPSWTVEMIRNNLTARQKELRLYLDILTDPSMEDTETIMIFLKHFDTTKQTLFGVGKIHMPRTTKVSDLIPIINNKMKWATGRRLTLYEEIKPDMVEPMELDHTLALSEIQDGDIVCFQTAISDKEARDLESKGLHSNPRQFYKSLQNQV